MPHKHKRRQNDSNIYDLPPSMIAKPLPTRDPQAKSKKKGKDAKKNPPPTQQSDYSRKSAGEDDTPKAFLRLMQRQNGGAQTSSKSLKSSKPETGESKKRKRGKTEDAKPAQKKSAAVKTTAEEPQTQSESRPAPKILPGERLSDFAARVDRELPISAMQKSSKPAASNIPGLKEEHRLTKHEKHLLRLQKQWREDDVAIKEREAAEREERQEEMEDQLRLWNEWDLEAGKGRAKKKGGSAKRKKTGDGDAAADDPDPWAKLAKRERMKKANPFEVAEAPPTLTKPKALFKVRGGAKIDVANVPTAAGSLRTREELAGERRSIVEQYRKLMAEKRQ
ncbi:hypothetical protein P170DRAFT_406739 [Aspergillus steynii IBT 23096]|uniref:Urease accessory protein UreD n=1 Tax=Aspergillus steynii IBT 23096 TaxID=1392250 RepID=A0A2I2GE36_9EURO|nr:uncharacterized protein P170DRAFT_406739 [Aspergillus steynii IBT 23096]PLB51122.1 hypothetical protein P170DRAFT_406739 [Aspergillus steynii IBT 23096]